MPEAIPKIRRNHPCPCGSGRKWKKCCGDPAGAAARQWNTRLEAARPLLEQHIAAEHIRIAQQGFGRPIISTNSHRHTTVMVGNAHHRGDWKTFSDFLCDYIKEKLGAEWGNAEIAKPFEARHPLIQWYQHLCLYQQALIPRPGVVTSMVSTGIVACYLQLAYGLYLLAHNVALQDRLLKRLKDVSNFQGAYYEVAVARILILAGFTLTLEDETDSTSKHCEFSALSKSGKKYWVEAKMRSISGVLGKTPADGGSADDDPGKTLVRHLGAALQKPAADTRLIFLDINTSTGIDSGAAPPWFRSILDRLADFERNKLHQIKQRICLLPTWLTTTNSMGHRYPA